MTIAVIRFIGSSPRAEAIKARIAAAEIERGDVVLRSRLASERPLNEHIVWLWGMLQQHRRFLKSLRSQGNGIVCECEVSRGSIHLLPNGAEMLHLLGIELVLKVHQRTLAAGPQLHVCC